MCMLPGNFDSISGNYAPFEQKKNCQKLNILPEQFVSATSLKLLNGISWNFVVMKDIME